MPKHDFFHNFSLLSFSKITQNMFLTKISTTIVLSFFIFSYNLGPGPSTHQVFNSDRRNLSSRFFWGFLVNFAKNSNFHNFRLLSFSRITQNMSLTKISTTIVLSQSRVQDDQQLMFFIQLVKIYLPEWHILFYRGILTRLWKLLYFN